MKLSFTFLSGARAGQTTTAQKSYIAIGRHPLSDVRFDAERDLDVSTRHAAILERGGEYVVRDLGSKNGTFLNGARLDSDHVVRDGDVIRFGIEGPAVELRLHRPSAPGGAPTAGPPAGQHGPGPTDLRVRAEVARRVAWHRQLTTGLLALLAVVLVGGMAFAAWQRAARRREIATLTARADSIQREAQARITALESEMRGLADAFRASQTEAQQLKTALAATPASDRAEVSRLRRELAEAQARQQALLTAAGIDYRAIAERNRRAVALIIVEHAPQERVVGTAFAIRADRLLATAKHLVMGAGGASRPSRIAVKFADSNQWFEGVPVAHAADADVALVQVRLRGEVPTVASIDEEPGPTVGDPVALIGFPLGFDLPMEGEGLDAYAAPTLTVGTVSKVVSSTIQIDGYGAAGSSGSPVFDRDGRVVAVVTSGQHGTAGRIVFAEPAARLAELVRSVPEQ